MKNENHLLIKFNKAEYQRAFDKMNSGGKSISVKEFCKLLKIDGIYEPIDKKK